MEDSVEAAQRYVRDEAALEGALAPSLPRHRSVASFVDGNKRSATVALLTFLGLNDVDLGVDDDVLFAWMLDIAQSGTSAVLAERIAGALRPVDGPFG
jgi:hypothetical protein